MTTHLTSMPASLRSFIDAAADAVARAIATVQREAQRERELREAEHRAKIAELDARLMSVAEVERRISERLATLKDGEPGKNGADFDPSIADARIDALVGQALARVDEAVSSIRIPKDGESVTVEDMKPTIDEAVRIAVNAIERPVGVAGVAIVGETDLVFTLSNGETVNVGRVVGWDGVDVDFDVVRQQLVEMFESVPKPKDGEPGKDGKLEAVKSWTDRVHYENEIVTFDGRLFQATKDTGKEPGHHDWLCIVDRGRDGEPGTNGRSLRIRETWIETNDYLELDVVALNGGSFVARCDEPGPCPGEGWQLLASPGKRGNPGERIKGDPGRPGPPVVAVDISADGVLTVVNGDGSTATCDFYPLLSRVK